MGLAAHAGKAIKNSDSQQNGIDNRMFVPFYYWFDRWYPASRRLRLLQLRCRKWLLGSIKCVSFFGRHDRAQWGVL